MELELGYMGDIMMMYVDRFRNGIVEQAGRHTRLGLKRVINPRNTTSIPNQINTFILVHILSTHAPRGPGQ